MTLGTRGDKYLCTQTGDSQSQLRRANSEVEGGEGLIHWQQETRREKKGVTEEGGKAAAEEGDTNKQRGHEHNVFIIWTLEAF